MGEEDIAVTQTATASDFRKPTAWYHLVYQEVRAARGKRAKQNGGYGGLEFWGGEGEMLPQTGGQASPHGDDIPGMRVSKVDSKPCAYISGWRTFQTAQGAKARPCNGGVPAAFGGGLHGQGRVGKEKRNRRKLRAAARRPIFWALQMPLTRDFDFYSHSGGS